ncbi:MAG: AAA family ATPase [Saprospiraceae bacterium]
MTIANKNTFPYIKALEINDCYAYQNLSVLINDDESIPFKHLILTGKNGSGKTTVLNFLNKNLKKIIIQNEDIYKKITQHKVSIENVHNNIRYKNNWKKEIKELEQTLPFFLNDISFFTISKREDILLTHFKASRVTKLEKVKGSTAYEDVINHLNNQNSQENFRKKLKQYLVNKKVSQAFSQIKGNQKEVNSIESFFNTFEEVLRNIFEDKNITLSFDDKGYEFYINLSGNRQITFNEFSDGFSAFINIILDLFTRVDIIREKVKDYTYEPCGFVLIDEPETHLHLELQYQVLPILTSLFPNLQFIVATHSPAVISSIKNATVYDLSTQKTVADWIVGSSYSELMMTHFGLENEYSNIADDIIETTQELVDNQKMSPAKKLEKLKNLFDENQKYLSPSLRLSLEVQVLKLENQLLTTTIND